MTTRIFVKSGRSGSGGLRFAKAGAYLAASTGEKTQIWDVAAGKMIRTAEGKLLDASLTQDSIVTSGTDAALLWNVDDALLSDIDPGTQIRAGAASADGAVATGSFDGKARIWTADGQLAATVDHGAPITFVLFSPDGRTVMTVGRNSSIRLWSRNGRLERELEQSSVVTGALFFPDDGSVLSVSVDGTGTIWGPDGGEVAKLDHNGAEVYCIAMSPDGRFAASGAADGVLRVWSRSGSLVWQAPTPGNVIEIAYSPDSQRLVAATTGKSVQIFDAASGRMIKDLPHGDKVRQIAVGNTILATSADDREVRVWNLEGSLLEALPHTEQTTSLAVSQDDLRIVTGSQDGVVRVWDLHESDLLDLVADSGDRRNCLRSRRCGDCHVLQASRAAMALRLTTGDRRALPGLDGRTAGDRADDCAGAFRRSDPRWRPAAESMTPRPTPRSRFRFRFRQRRHASRCRAATSGCCGRRRSAPNSTLARVCRRTLCFGPLAYSAAVRSAGSLAFLIALQYLWESWPLLRIVFPFLLYGMM